MKIAAWIASFLVTSAREVAACPATRKRTTVTTVVKNPLMTKPTRPMERNIVRTVPRTRPLKTGDTSRSIPWISTRRVSPTLKLRDEKHIAMVPKMTHALTPFLNLKMPRNGTKENAVIVPKGAKNV